MPSLRQVKRSDARPEASEEIVINNDDLWKLIDFALALMGNKFGVPDGRYNSKLVATEGDMQLVLTKASDALVGAEHRANTKVSRKLATPGSSEKGEDNG